MNVPYNGIMPWTHAQGAAGWGINHEVNQFIEQKSYSARTGIVGLDFYHNPSNLVTKIINQNFSAPLKSGCLHWDSGDSKWKTTGWHEKTTESSCNPSTGSRTWHGCLYEENSNTPATIHALRASDTRIAAIVGSNKRLCLRDTAVSDAFYEITWSGTDGADSVQMMSRPKRIAIKDTNGNLRAGEGTLGPSDTLSWIRGYVYSFQLEGNRIGVAKHNSNILRGQ